MNFVIDFKKKWIRAWFMFMLRKRSGEIDGLEDYLCKGRQIKIIWFGGEGQLNFPEQKKI
jgi:hypothetical protein